ncbi:MAG: hypothetical protein WCR67_07270, partial [Bacilli bacterium]
IKEHDSYDSVSHFKENNRVFHNKKKSDKQKLHSVITIVAWSLIAAIVIALIAVLIYVIIRGNQ